MPDKYFDLHSADYPEKGQLAMPVRKAWIRLLKRGKRNINGRAESLYSFKFEGETVMRRAYEDWANADTTANHSRDWRIPLVYLRNGHPVPLTQVQIDTIIRLGKADWAAQGN